MRRRLYNNTPACGRTKEDSHKCCTNPDNTFRSNRIVLTKFQFYRYKGKRLKFRIHYEIRCKKCGHVRESGNCFGISVIKELLTGQVWF